MFHINLHTKNSTRTTFFHKLPNILIILNSFSANQDREMIQYQWLTLEEQLKASVLGFVPYLKNELLDQMSLALESMMEEPWPNPEES